MSHTLEMAREAHNAPMPRLTRKLHLKTSDIGDMDIETLMMQDWVFPA